MKFSKGFIKYITAKKVSAQSDSFFQAYVTCALWSSSGDDGEPLDANYNDIAPEALSKMKADCDRFQSENADDLSNLDLSQAGHDFWLTRNHHGAGFWDRGHDKQLGERLTAASHKFGESDLYVGDDGKVYIS